MYSIQEYQHILSGSIITNEKEGDGVCRGARSVPLSVHVSFRLRHRAQWCPLRERLNLAERKCRKQIRQRFEPEDLVRSEACEVVLIKPGSDVSN